MQIKREEKDQPEQCNFIRKLAIFTHKKGVYNPEINCSNCSTVAKQPVSSVNFVTILRFFFANFG